MSDYYSKTTGDKTAYPEFINALKEFNNKYQMELEAPSQDQLHKGFDSAMDDGTMDDWTKELIKTKWRDALNQTKY